jgi:hypothetical protein
LIADDGDRVQLAVVVELAEVELAEVEAAEVEAAERERSTPQMPYADWNVAPPIPLAVESATKVVTLPELHGILDGQSPFSWFSPLFEAMPLIELWPL